jgi:5-methyltetrahydrofolate--homocysteine methyltransferase
LIGLSNVSFGLPEREKINSTFLAMAVSHGLTAAIANPGSEDIMSAKFTSDALDGRDEGCKKYVLYFSKNAQQKEEKKVSVVADPLGRVRESVLNGDREHVLENIELAVSAGHKASEIISAALIPAIREVGNLYEKKIYFLPQLIMSAEAVKKSFDKLERMLAEEEKGKGISGAAKRKVILATVKGDIHDIGKNIVALILKNHGYSVLDLGKDVSAEKIIREAKSFLPDAIGLSALMTTTMPMMKSIIADCRSAGFISTKYIVGGAAVDKDFALSIKADGYAGDAVEAVRILDSMFDLSKKTVTHQ